MQTVIDGRFYRVSKTTYKDGVVLVGFTGRNTPRNLTEEEIEYIKGFFGMSGSKHEALKEWPDFVEAVCDAEKKNSEKNGYLLLKKVKLRALNELQNGYGQVLFQKGNTYDIIDSDSKRYYVMNDLHLETPVRKSTVENDFEIV